MSDEQLPTITDEVFTEALTHAREYTLAILKRTERTSAPESRPIIWEHGRRNIALRAAGILAYEVHPVRGFPGDSLPG